MNLAQDFLCVWGELVGGLLDHRVIIDRDVKFGGRNCPRRGRRGTKGVDFRPNFGMIDRAEVDRVYVGGYGWLFALFFD